MKAVQSEVTQLREMPKLLSAQPCRNPTAASPCSSTPTKPGSSIRTPIMYGVEYQKPLQLFLPEEPGASLSSNLPPKSLIGTSV